MQSQLTISGAMRNEEPARGRGRAPPKPLLHVRADQGAGWQLHRSSNGLPFYVCVDDERALLIAHLGFARFDGMPTAYIETRRTHLRHACTDHLLSPSRGNEFDVRGLSPEQAVERLFIVHFC